MLAYGGIGAGVFSYVTGTCDQVGNGTTFVVAEIAPQFQLLGSTELQCDSAGRFAGYVNGTLNLLLGEQTSNLYIVPCGGGTGCVPSAGQTVPVTVRELDAVVRSPWGFQGASTNRYLQMDIDSGQQIASESGATGFFMAALYGGTIFMIYGGDPIQCGNGPQVMLGPAGSTSSPCYQLVITPFSPQTFIPIAVGAAGQRSTGSVTVSFGSLDGIHGVTVLGGVAKSFDELMTQKQYGAIVTLY
jgi:hypothetical protein